jgi:hypothetical protein
MSSASGFASTFGANCIQRVAPKDAVMSMLMLPMHSKH